MADEEYQKETDDRFPSGPWIGFYLQKARPGKHQMELSLYFRDGNVWGDGRDRVGTFLIRGQYELKTGKTRFHKKYLGKHDVYYDGFNEGKGIWGNWEIPPVEDVNFDRGGFHIWPKGMRDPTQPALEVAEDLPVDETTESPSWNEEEEIDESRVKELVPIKRR